MSDRVENFLRIKKGRTVDFGSDGFIREQTERINYYGREKAGTNDLNNHLKLNKAPIDPDILETFVMDLEGEIIASSNPEHIGQKRAEADYFRDARRYGHCITDLHLHHGMEADRLVIEISWLLHSRRAEDVKTIGVLVNRLKGDSLVNLLTEDTSSDTPARQSFGGVTALQKLCRQPARTPACPPGSAVRTGTYSGRYCSIRAGRSWLLACAFNVV